jgi:hypothetical protein
MAYTPTFSQGVKFIKIARIDDQGKDNTLSLQELNSIRIDYSNTGIIEYPITSISKYDDYFLFGVAPTNVTSSTDNQVLNYRASGSSRTTIAGGNDINVTNYTESYDNLGYFNTSSGQYVLGNQTNIPIQFITSASVTGSASGGVTIQIYSNIGGVVASQTEALGGSPWEQKLSASYSGTAQEGEQFYINVINSSVSGISYTGSFYVTQSVAPTSSISDLVVLQPYLDENFYVSDYNVLAGNALEPRVNPFYMDVDYSTNIIKAVNFNQIISGSATRATVQESNYTTAAIINSRYIGKELNSAKFNEWTVGDVAYGLTPNVSNPEVNFVSFNTLGGTSPHWGNNNVDMTQVGINYIINANGNATKPINDSKGINLGTIQQSFEQNKNAILSLDNNETSGANLTTLNGQWSIYKSGYKIEPIIYTQTASYDSNGNVTGFGYFNSMSFVQGEQGPNDTKNDYMMYAPGINYNTIISGNQDPNQTIEFTTPSFLGTSASFSTSSDSYSPIGSLSQLSGSGYILDFKIYLNATALSQNQVVYGLLKNGQTVALTTIDYRQTTNGYLFYQDTAATTSSTYQVKALYWSSNKSSTGQTYPTNYGYPQYTPVQLDNNSYFSVSQYPNPGTGTCTAPFWTTGSSANILLASTASDGLNNYRNQKQKDINKSGFNPINLDFEPQVYDEIRFQGIEQLSFVITAVTSSNNQLQLNLNKNIPNGVNLDYFLLRRYVEDPSSIILDVNFPIPDNSGSVVSAGNGILKPQYITKELESSIDTIVQNLKNQNLI